MQPRLFIFTKR